MSAIRILITGGTFDKEYDLLNGKLFFQNSHVEEMLTKGRCTLNYSTRTLMMIDSLDMTDLDRTIICNHCKESIEDKIIITHGTDTMVETAHLIGKENIQKTIVITGALIPYTFGSSDGMFNLGSSIAYVQSLPNGVYVVMNGIAFPWNKVTKNKKTGYFENI